MTLIIAVAFIIGSASLAYATTATNGNISGSANVTATTVKHKLSDFCRTFNFPATGINPTVSDCTSKSEKDGSGTIGVTADGFDIHWTAPFENGDVIHVRETGIFVGRPGQPPDEKEPKGKACPAGPQEQEIEVSGDVVSTTPPNADDDTRGTVTFEWCEDANGNLTLEPGTVLAISEPPGDH
jgi:hypothetical protein